MAILSSAVNDGDIILASQYNNLRIDLLTGDITIAGVKSFSDDIKLAALKKFYLDNGDNTYIYESAPDNIQFVTGGTTALQIDSAQGVIVFATKKFYLDSGGDSYFVESAANIIDVYTGGSLTFRFLANQNVNPKQDLLLDPTKKLRLDGSSSGGTYIYESAANQITFKTNNNTILNVKTDGISIESTQKFYLDGGSDAYIVESSSNIMDFYAGNRRILRLDGFNSPYSLVVDSVAAITPIGDGAINLGSTITTDFGTLFYHILSQHSGKKDKQNIVGINIATLKADKLPDPKTYERKMKPGVIEYGLIADDCPEEVIFRENGKIAGIQTNALIAYMSGVIKEMNARIKILEGA